MTELREMTTSRAAWHKGHDLFDRIRDKTLQAEGNGDKVADCQYLFEEVCAQTLYNMSGAPMPFDPDTPFWIIPNALALARRIGIDAALVIAAISPKA